MIQLAFWSFVFVPFVSGANTTLDSPNNGMDIADFFGIAKENLTAITWAHAVNSQELLTEALNGTAMMLEADVSLGTLNGSAVEIPIMAHPPANVSDLSLEDFLEKVYDYNNENGTQSKGIKLDFKTVEAFEASISVINELYPKIEYPVWLNADILPGPFNSTVTPVDAARFIGAAKKFENSTLSIGWTTNYGSDSPKASYTTENVREMVEVIRGNNVSQSITFPVRAGIAAQSMEELSVLVSNVSQSTLTIWSSVGDPVDVENLRGLIAKIGIDRIYIDVPEELEAKLKLDKLNGVGTVKPLIAVSLMSLLLAKLL